MISCKNIIDVALLIKFKVRECSNFYFRGVKTKVKKKIIYIYKKKKIDKLGGSFEPPGLNTTLPLLQTLLRNISQICLKYRCVMRYFS